MSLIYSCATSYQSTAYTGGFSETQLDENVYKVIFRGNGYTSSERASDFCLLRCAELCLSTGYTYFIIVENQDRSKQYQYTTPSRTTTTGRANVIGNSVYGSSSSTTSGGQTYNISKPRSENTIICFKEKPEYFSYNAEFIYRNISAKYGIIRQDQK